MRIVEALEVVSETHPGMSRAHNEDSVAVEPGYGLVILADGMGGYNAGEVASGIAVTVMASEIVQHLANASPIQRDEETGEELAVMLLGAGIRQANASIYQAAISQSQYAGMGTTIVSALFYDNRVVIGHVGDSRAYRLRGEKLELITRDHSLLQEQIDSGMISIENARHSKNKNLVTRAVGIDAEVVPEIHLYDVAVGDVYLLCSDGLNDMVEDEDIESVLYGMQGNLPLAAEQLIQIANDNGGRDNVSVILVKVKHAFAQPRSWWVRLLDYLNVKRA
ncbi:MAG: protein phosphatase [Gallionellaceae bacterium CG1_02_56_997]|nr:MAG: protein phosphatase [Gallionellaceae bacterium CG1_02_56_997]PIV15841.1 MAG: protein phosphatase [Gallionellales bacterium CG03_land_8_20_14_0_80_55_15]HCJ51298.1 Stp1/IreP family PP2C-type Ser/Thr phosphatase [Gallionella sp.]